MSQVNTNSTASPTIATLLRDKDLEFKKINKDALNVVGVSALVDQSKTPKELVQATQTFQSVYDKLGYVTKVLSQLRKANVLTKTEAKNFFTQQELNVTDCRQNMVGDQNVGLKSEVYYLRQLYNHAIHQANTVKTHINSHNTLMKAQLERDLKSEDKAHENERNKLKERKMAIPDNFESTFTHRLEEMTKTFWHENKATQVDPLNIFLFLSELKTWLDDYEKNREMRLNRANHGPIGNVAADANTENSQTVSLEELMSYVKDYSSKIEYAFSKLVLVSWRVGTKDPNSHDIAYAEERLNELKTLIKTYGEMQSIQKMVTSTVFIGVQNPLTNEEMTASDVVDFKHTVVPIFTKMLARIESQQKEANELIKAREPDCRAKVMEVLKESMSTSSGRLSTDQLKEYTKGLMDSSMPKLTTSEGLEVWLGKYQQVLDHVESTMNTALATVNANTRVPVTWMTVTVPTSVGSWDDMTVRMESLSQPSVSTDTYSHKATSSSLYGAGGRL